MRRRMVATAAVGSGLALALTGCLGESGDGAQGNTGNVKLTAAQALAKTSQKTGQADSFRADVTVDGTGDGAVKIRAGGQFQLRPTLAFSGRLEEFSRNGQSVPGVTGQAVFTGNVLYAKVPQLAQFAGGKPWLKFDLNRAQQRTGIDFGQIINQIQQANPADLTKMFTGSKDVRRVGTESIDGTETTHYSGTVTAREALARLDPAQRDKWRDVLPQGADQKINFDIWTDKNQLPRKLVTKGQDDSGHRATVTLMAHDYGKPITVNPPPADQVGDVTALSGLLDGAPRN